MFTADGFIVLHMGLTMKLSYSHKVSLEIGQNIGLCLTIWWHNE